MWHCGGYPLVKRITTENVKNSTLAHKANCKRYSLLI